MTTRPVHDTPTTCPKCASPTVQRVETARSLGRTVVRVQGNTVGAGVGVYDGGVGLGVARTSVEGVVETEFAQALAPPVQGLKTGGFIGGGAIIAVVIGAILGSVWGFKVLDEDSSDAFAIVALSILAYAGMTGIVAVTALATVYRLVFRVTGTQLEAFDALQEHKDRESLTRWQQQWVCLTCGERFTPAGTTNPEVVDRLDVTDDVLAKPTGSRALWAVLVLAAAAPWLLNRRAPDAVEILMTAGSQLTYAVVAGLAIGVLVAAGHRLGVLADPLQENASSTNVGKRPSRRAEMPAATSESRQVKKEFEQWLAKQPAATRPSSAGDLAAAFSEFKKSRSARPSADA